MGRGGGGGGRSGGGGGGGVQVSSRQIKQAVMGLSSRSLTILQSFSGDRAESRDVTQLPGVTRGSSRAVTGAGADAVNALADRGLIRPSALIGRSGQRVLQLTELGRAARLRAGGR